MRRVCFEESIGSGGWLAIDNGRQRVGAAGPFAQRLWAVGGPAPKGESGG
jgi:hypothetical protein